MLLLTLAHDAFAFGFEITLLAPGARSWRVAGSRGAGENFDVVNSCVATRILSYFDFFFNRIKIAISAAVAVDRNLQNITITLGATDKVVTIGCTCIRAMAFQYARVILRYYSYG